jgi:hypothetical protein
MAKAAQRAGLETWLIRIDLPGMQIKNRRPALQTIYAADAPPRPFVREDTEISSACDRKIQRPEPGRRRRRLDESPARTLEQVGMARRERDAVPIVPNRKDARVVAISLLDQDVQSPEGFRRDRIARRAIAEDLTCGRALQQVLCAPHVFAECFRCLVVDQPVSVPV